MQSQAKQIGRSIEVIPVSHGQNVVVWKTSIFTPKFFQCVGVILVTIVAVYWVNPNIGKSKQAIERDRKWASELFNLRSACSGLKQGLYTFAEYQEYLAQANEIDPMILQTYPQYLAIKGDKKNDTCP